MMTLCEALDWCRANNANVAFEKAKVHVTCKVSPGTLDHVTALTIEEAVDKLVCRIAQRLEGDWDKSVADAARREYGTMYNQEYNPESKLDPRD